MVVCVHLPRFELLVAAGGEQGASLGRQTLEGRALAVAPVPGGGGSASSGARARSAWVGAGARIGEVSGSAEAHGVRRGMALGEALARCPELVLVPADPVAVAEEWERALRALESIGAAVEPARAGTAFFEPQPLRALHGTLAATLAAAAAALGRRARVGAAPTRFGALAAALAVRSRRPLVLEGERSRRWLGGQPIELLAHRPQTAELPAVLERLGVHTLGEITRLGRAAMSDRFGSAGALAHGLAGGEDTPLHPRRVHERVEESMAVGEANSGVALARVLGVLVDRLLARAELRGRTVRAAILSAQLLPGGGWRERVIFRQALRDPERIRLALSVRLLAIPAPAATLRLSVEGFGPAPAEQVSLLEQERTSTRAQGEGGERRARELRLREALAQARALAGQDAALRAHLVDPDSRVPERRVVLAPIPE
jgi:protein ImuB